MSNDDQAKNARFAAKHDFGFPLLCDTDLTMSVAYGAAAAGARAAKRAGVIIDADGTILLYKATVGASTFPAEALAALGGAPEVTVTATRSNAGIDNEAHDGEVKVYAETTGLVVTVP